METKPASTTAGCAGGPSGLDEVTRARLEKFVTENAGEALDLFTLATVAGYSPSHFGRLFKRSFGCRPHYYLMCARVEKAAELLANTWKKECEIARLCGFSDETLLARWFRRVKGRVPSEFRMKRAG